MKRVRAMPNHPILRLKVSNIVKVKARPARKYEMVYIEIIERVIDHL